jgi:NADH-quinone oxidoreductase subunit G
VPAAEPGDVQRRGRVPVLRVGRLKRTFPKPINISAQVLLDRERCVLCARCTRFSEQIAGDPFIALIERGALQQVGIYEKEPFESYFSGNTIQICPVGRADLADVPLPLAPVRPGLHAVGRRARRLRLRDPRRPPRGKVMRRLAGNDPEVNEEWITDKDRFAFHYATAATGSPTRRCATRTAELRPASWPEAFAVAAAGCARPAPSAC